MCMEASPASASGRQRQAAARVRRRAGRGRRPARAPTAATSGSRPQAIWAAGTSGIMRPATPPATRQRARWRRASEGDDSERAARVPATTNATSSAAGTPVAAATRRRASGAQARRTPVAVRPGEVEAEHVGPVDGAGRQDPADHDAVRAAVDVRQDRSPAGRRRASTTNQATSAAHDASRTSPAG